MSCGASCDSASRLFSTIRRGRRGFYTDEAELPCKDGSSVWVEMVTTYCRNLRTGRIELHGVSRDISERRASQARIAYMAEHDMLTDLPNRALVTDRLRQALTAARRNLHRVALLYIDLDRFKPVNDIHGHAAGDQLLRQAAARMRQCVRESDTVGRFGGDEFVALLPDIESVADAARVAEKIRVALGEPFQIAGLTLEVSSSIGIAVFPEHGTDDVGLLLHADSAMYDAKHGGRNRVAVFRHRRRTLVRSRTQLLTLAYSRNRSAPPECRESIERVGRRVRLRGRVLSSLRRADTFAGR